LKNLNKISYLEIKNYLLKNNLNPISDLVNEVYFESLKAIGNADVNDLTFFTNNFSKEEIKSTNAKACLIDRKNSKLLPSKTFPIIVDDPYKSFAIISNIFNQSNVSNGIISNNSEINKKAKIGKNVQIDTFVNIKKNCKIDDNVIIESNCTIGPNVNIGENSIIKSNSIIENSIIGQKCIIKSGSVIGGVGFGFDLVSKIRIQHIGNVIIKNNCNIGSNTNIDRAVFDSTIIYENCFIDNLVQIAHNVIIGKGSIIAAQSGIAGSTILGENVIIGGQSGISGHLKIGNNVTIAAKSGVTKNIKDHSTVAGFPAVDIKKWKLTQIKLNKI